MSTQPADDAPPWLFANRLGPRVYGDNRESPPKGRAALEVPAPYRPREDEIDAAVRRDFDAMDPGHRRG